MTVAINFTVSATGLESLLAELIPLLKGLSVDIQALKPALETATQQLNATSFELAATKGVLEKVVGETTSLLVQIQTLTDLLGQAGQLPPDVVTAVEAVNAAVAAVKAASADVKTAAGAADALVPDEPAA